MKQNFTHFFFLAFFVALLMPLSVLAEDIPVAILTTNADGKTKTLTFTYADQSALNQPGNGLDGTYELNSGENRPGWFKWNNDIVTKVVFTDAFAKARPTTTYYWFADMYNLTTIEGLSNLNTEEVTNMRGMFSSCRKLENVNVSGFNTSKVTNMCNMFSVCTSLTSIDVSGFNTSNVTDMSQMFFSCKLDSIDISNFDMSNVKKDCVGDFLNCQSLRMVNLGNIDFSRFSSHMFNDVGCGWPCLLIVGSAFNTSVLGEKDECGCYNWSGGYFSLSKNAMVPVVQVITNADGVTKTLKFSCKEMDLTKLSEYKKEQTYPLNEGPYVNPGWMPKNGDTTFSSVEFDVSFAKARPRSTDSWFAQMTGLKQITGIEHLNTSKTTAMGGMFSGCSSLTHLDVSGFATDNVISMDRMFSGCGSLTHLDVSNFNTDKVQRAHEMFQLCSSLESIKVCVFNGNGSLEMFSMFYGCSSLTSLDISAWSFHEGTRVGYMFDGCTSLSTLNLGANDFTYKREYDDYDIFGNVGTAEKPCSIIVNEKFKTSVLGDVITNGSNKYYKWSGGYFAEPTVVPTAIESVSMDKGFNQNAPAYNLSGQRVGKDYKGIVIKKGRKYVRK